MVDETQEWRVGQAEFQGYVKAKLEENTEAHNVIFKKLDTQGDRIGTTEVDMSNLKGRLAIFGAIGGAIILVVRELIRVLIGR